jgi:hypothetical protein
VRQATALRDQIANAVTSGDDDAARSLVQQAQKFDKANPAFAVLPRVGDAIRRRAKVSATAQALNDAAGGQSEGHSGAAAH